jgi:hypothetical protein
MTFIGGENCELRVLGKLIRKIKEFIVWAKKWGWGK